jgi:hypothetical protein
LFSKAKVLSPMDVDMCNRSTILRVTVVVVEKEIISNSSSKRENPEPPVVEEYEEINLRDIRQQRQV